MSNPGLALATVALLAAIPIRSLCQISDIKIPVSATGIEGPQKLENGLQIFWHDNEPLRPEPDRDSIVEVFDSSRNRLASCNLTSAIRQADPNYTDISIYDVTARKPGFIAVSAVYARKVGSPAAVLLYFNWDGSLTTTLTLHNVPQIERLELDETGHLWALNDFDRNSPTPSVFTEFVNSGSIVKRFVRPQRDWSTDESISTGGESSFGLKPGGAWAWLPRSRTLISLDESSGKTMIRKTGLPHISASTYVHARRAVLLQDGQLLFDVGWRTKDHFASQWFLWTAVSGWRSAFQ